MLNLKKIYFILPIFFIILLTQNFNLAFCDEIIESSVENLENNQITNNNQLVWGLTLFVGTIFFVIYILNNSNSGSPDVITPIINSVVKDSNSIIIGWDSELMEKTSKNMVTVIEPIKDSLNTTYITSLQTKLSELEHIVPRLELANTTLQSRVFDLESQLLNIEAVNRNLSGALLEKHKVLQGLDYQHQQVIEMYKKVNWFSKKLMIFNESIMQEYRVPGIRLQQFMDSTIYPGDAS